MHLTVFLLGDNIGIKVNLLIMPVKNESFVLPGRTGLPTPIVMLLSVGPLLQCIGLIGLVRWHIDRSRECCRGRCIGTNCGLASGLYNFIIVALDV